MKFIKNLLKLIGVGVVSGGACRLGSMLIDALFPNGLRKFLSKSEEPKQENENQPKKKQTFLQRWVRG